jgi:protein SCO1/2
MSRKLTLISHCAARRRAGATLLTLLLLLAVAVSRLSAQAPNLPPRLDLEQKLPGRADLEQKLGAQIPLDLTFTDETGQVVPLRHFFGARPVILQLGYNHCWLMCDVVTGALVRSLQDLRLDTGRDFDVVFVSIDPRETWQSAARKRTDFVRSYGRSKTGQGWHFLIGQQPQITALASAVGFHYFYDPPSQQFAHPSGIMIATPQGVLSKYFYGVEYDPHLLRQSLLEASGGTVGSRVESLLLLCYHWNPMSGKYGLIISRVIKVLCLGTVALLIGFIIVSLRREARRRGLAEAPPFSP